MPAESIPPLLAPGSSFHPSQLNIIKCTVCGIGGFAPPRATITPDGVEGSDRVCEGCVRARELIRSRGSTPPNEPVDPVIEPDHVVEEVPSIDLAQDGGLDSDMLGLGLRNVRLTDRPQTPETPAHPSHGIPQPLDHREFPRYTISQSLPVAHTRPWTTSASSIQAIPESIAPSRIVTPSPPPPPPAEDARLPNPLLDVTKARVPNSARGALYPGSVFRGTQTSGRSAYEVEVKFLVRSRPAHEQLD